MSHEILASICDRREAFHARNMPQLYSTGTKESRHLTYLYKYFPGLVKEQILKGTIDAIENSMTNNTTKVEQE